MTRVNTLRSESLLLHLATTLCVAAELSFASTSHSIEVHTADPNLAEQENQAQLGAIIA